MTKDEAQRDRADCVIGSDYKAHANTTASCKMRPEEGASEPAPAAPAGMEAAEALGVKVIVQDQVTKYYLSANGCWVAEEHAARDFRSLLPAYHFARNFTSRGFKVLLYCAEDNYRAVIIEGEGTGEEDFEASFASTPTNVKNATKAKQVSTVSHWDRFNGCMRMMQSELN
jgi:hypothetical protein